MSEFRRKTVETFALRVLTLSFGVVTGIVMARALGPTGKGVFAYATTVVALLVTISGGASAAISRQYGRLHRPRGVVYASMLRFFLTIVLPIAAIVAAAGSLTHQTALAAAAVVFACAFFTQTSMAFLLADGEVRWANIQGLLIAAALALAVAALCWGFHYGVGAALVAWACIYVAMGLYSLRVLAPFRGEAGTAGERRTAFVEQLQFGARVTANQLLSALNYQIDIFIVLYMLGHASLGVYSVAVGVGQMLWQFSQPLAVTSYGRVTRGSPEEAARTTVLCVRHALLTVGAAAVVLFLVGPWLVQFVYGARFAQSGIALRWLLPGIVAYCVVPFFAQYFTLQLGRPAINTAVIGTSTLVCAVVTVALARHFGIVAGAIGTSLSYSAAFTICAIIFCRRAHVPFLELLTVRRSDLQQYTALLSRS